MIEETAPALGAVVETDRGSLPFTLIHGEALVACATWALGEAGVVPVDFTTTWETITEAEEPFVLHDSLCPMTPAEFIARCVETAVERDAVVVAVRPVTDTVKTVAGGLVGDTIDRSELVEVTSPIVLPPAVVETFSQAPAGDFATIASELAERFPVVMVQAPAAGRRVADLADVRLLEALTQG